MSSSSTTAPGAGPATGSSSSGSSSGSSSSRAATSAASTLPSSAASQSRISFRYFFPLILFVALFAVWGALSSNKKVAEFHKMKDASRPVVGDLVGITAAASITGAVGNGTAVRTKPAKAGRAGGGVGGRSSERGGGKSSSSSSGGKSTSGATISTSDSSALTSAKDAATASSKKGSNEEKEEKCCEKQKITNALAGKASDEEIKKYEAQLAQSADGLRAAREAVKKGGPKADEAAKLITAFVDGKISKNKFDASVKKLEL